MYDLLEFLESTEAETSETLRHACSTDTTDACPKAAQAQTLNRDMY